MAFVRRDLAPGGRRRRADSGKGCSWSRRARVGLATSRWRAMGDGQRVGTVQAAINNSQSKVNGHARELAEVSRQRPEGWLVVRVATRCAEEPGEIWSQAAASLKPSVSVGRAATVSGWLAQWSRAEAARTLVEVVEAVVCGERWESAARAGDGQRTSSSSGGGSSSRWSATVETATTGVADAGFVP